MEQFKRTMSNILGNLLGLDVIFICIYFMATHWVNFPLDVPAMLLIGAIVLAHLVMMFWLYCAYNVAWQDYQDELQSVEDDNPAIVDPWELQRSLMAASGQELPATPVLNKGGLLYAALLMEETGETLTALHKILYGLRSFETTHERSAIMVMQIMFRSLGDDLEQQSRRLRDLIGAVTFNHPLSTDEAVELLDGTTDVAVVNCGLALACGLPGSDAYSEVVCSNLSKANPATGVIDKTADGKWIKGRAYFKPNLTKVLHRAGTI